MIPDFVDIPQTKKWDNTRRLAAQGPEERAWFLEAQQNGVKLGAKWDRNLKFFYSEIEHEGFNVKNNGLGKVHVTKK